MPGKRDSRPMGFPVVPDVREQDLLTGVGVSDFVSCFRTFLVHVVTEVSRNRGIHDFVIGADVRNQIFRHNVTGYGAKLNAIALPQ